MSESARVLVSVVIPCYNQGRFLRSSIASVRAQRFNSAEVIVVDDGSNDDTSSVAAELGAAVIRQANSGVSAARNAGLAAAAGSFVIFLDADDELLDGAIETGVNALTAAPGMVCAVGRCAPLDAAGNALPVPPPHIVGPDLYRHWLSENFVWAPGAAIFRREQFADGFPTHVGPAADYAVYLRLARAGRVVDHGRVVLGYRQHPSSMSRDNARMLRATMTVLREERRFLPPSYAADYERGLASWRNWYGERIVDDIRRDWRQRRLRAAHAGDIATLVRYCPAVVARHVVRKLSRDVRTLVHPPRRRPG